MKSVRTLIVNPIMGHISTSYTSHIVPSTILSTRYDFNVYSYDSDVSIGIEVTKDDQVLALRLSKANVSHH